MTLSRRVNNFYIFLFATKFLFECIIEWKTQVSVKYMKGDTNKKKQLQRLTVKQNNTKSTNDAVAETARITEPKTYLISSEDGCKSLTSSILRIQKTRIT